MSKDKKVQNAAVVNADGSKKDTPVNPWTETFIQLTRYLIKDYSDRVKLNPQFELFQKPMRIDAVIIIQEEGLVIDNALMRSFKRHNIVEFKSPNDTLNIQAFDKTISYFYAYLSNERKTETPPIGFNDVTLSIISVRKPVKLLKMLQDERKYKIVDTETAGIYYITKEGVIPEKILLVVSSELPDDESDQSLIWLRSLRNDLTPGEAAEALTRAETIDDYESIWNIVRFILTVNPVILKEVDSMVEDPRVQQIIDKFSAKFSDRIAAIKADAEERRAEERAREIARRMVAKNMPIDDIVEVTGLDRADVVMIASAMA